MRKRFTRLSEEGPQKNTRGQCIPSHPGPIHSKSGAQRRTVRTLGMGMNAIGGHPLV